MSLVLDLHRAHQERQARLFNGPRVAAEPDPGLLNELAALRAANSRLAAENAELRRELARLRPNETASAQHPTIGQIKKLVAARFNIDPMVMEQARRDAQAVLPRQIAIYLCCRLTLRSMPFIGRQFGDRDHTTIMYARDKIAEMRERNPDIDAHVVALESVLRGTV